MSTFTLFHVVISLVGIGAGLIVIFGFLRGMKLPYSNALFLVMTIATSVTGFFFPYKGITPGIVVGIISLVILALAVLALIKRWTNPYIVSCIAAEFFNVMVLIVQSFAKIPALHALAPTGKEPIVAVCQGTELVVFAALAWIAIRKKAFLLR